MFCCKENDLIKCPQEFKEMMSGPLLQCAQQTDPVELQWWKDSDEKLRKTRERRETTLATILCFELVKRSTESGKIAGRICG
jgi:hypothetical protein